jgi:tetratricopeptide (TPR) repeat protein
VAAEPIDKFIERPQPIGIFPLPAGYLLLPATTDRAAAANVLRGTCPHPWPAEWCFLAAVLDRDMKTALELLPPGPLGDYNRLVLSPSAEQFEQARKTPLRPLAEVVGYSLGLIDRPPAADGLTGELLAHVLAAHAAYAIAANDRAAAEEHLTAAVTAARDSSPLLAAQLLGQLAALLKDDPDRFPEAVNHYKDAIQFAGDTPLVWLRAELWLSLGLTYQEQADGRRGMLLEAIKAYQQAIACGLSMDCHADLFAEAHNNLALAYLSVPPTAASDQLRMAVALQSFREALKVFTKEAQPERWASTTLNLANALQYLPSGHPAENLMQAVALYDEVLTVRTRASDPVGYARVLANQANALAHLGQFSQALEKLNEAYKLFHWHEEPQAAASVMELVDQITVARNQAAAPVGG